MTAGIESLMASDADPMVFQMSRGGFRDAFF